MIGEDVMVRPRSYLQQGKTKKRILKALEYQSRRESPGCLSPERPETLGWLWVLGNLEPVFRGFRPLSDIDGAALGSAPVTPRSAMRWLANLVTEDLASELTALIRSLACIIPKGPYRSNPIFGGYGFVIGSDGDFMAGHTLVEIKCSVSGVRRNSVSQMLSYFAIDRLNHGTHGYGVRQLALCLPRQQATIIGTVDEWLSFFGGPSPKRFIAMFAEYVK
ncbi:MAG: hypothetical protein HY283_05110 [Nitrospirae bacterium]|nr:hypothetical protein [Nitrospirota bacterium]